MMTTTDFEFVCRLVRERSAVVLEEGKEYLVESRLAPLARQLQFGSVGDLIGRLRWSPDDGLHTRVIEAMVTTETSFFRDLHPFEGLTTAVVPELIRARKGERQLNVWSAACSTGQEPYSFVIMLRERFPELTDWRVNVLATDLSTEVLRRAREGRYNQIEANRGLPAALLLKYFHQRGTTWELREDIRRSVEFREMNLARPWPALPKMDIVFLRNVMIYFDVETKKTILGRVARLLRSDGYLLLGGAETTLNLDVSFHRAGNIKGGFYQLVK
jgi:chemotaxis protein methyltransferase CheR